MRFIASFIFLALLWQDATEKNRIVSDAPFQQHFIQAVDSDYLSYFDVQYQVIPVEKFFGTEEQQRSDDENHYHFAGSVNPWSERLLYGPAGLSDGSRADFVQTRPLFLLYHSWKGNLA